MSYEKKIAKALSVKKKKTLNDKNVPFMKLKISTWLHLENFEIRLWTFENLIEHSGLSEFVVENINQKLFTRVYPIRNTFRPRMIKKKKKTDFNRKFSQRNISHGH